MKSVVSLKLGMVLCSFGDNCRYRHVLPGGAYSSNLASKNGQ